MTPQELRRSVIQFAIQGKLNVGLPEDGTGVDVVRNITDQKTELIKAKIIKKEKALPAIADGEIPFAIPGNWCWVRLRDICTKIVDGDHNPPAGVNRKTEYWMLSAQNINQNQLVNLDQVRYLTKEVFDQCTERTSAQKGDIFLTIVATLGRSCVYECDNNICFQRSVSVISTLIYNYYLKYVFDSGYIQDTMVKNATGTAQKGFYLNQVERLVIPVPPMAEQKRIVAKLEEILPLIDRYEAAWNKLEEFNKRFPVDMQKSILQLAIQGKLVEQRPEEGTGEELFQQIQAEKQVQFNAGKYRKEKPLPEINAEEVPFDIPDSWSWVRLSQICNISDGTHQTPKYVESGMPFISALNVKPYKFMPEIHRDVSYEDYLSYNKNISPEKGDILMTRVGAGIGEAAIIDVDMDFSIYVSLTLIKCYLRNYDMRYLLYVLNSPHGRKLAEKKTLGKGASQGNLNLIFIREFLVPLPPLAEQKRIVTKLEEILPLCDRLK